MMFMSLTVLIDAIWIEPNWLEITHHTLTVPIQRPLTIAHLTDLHIKGYGRREQAMVRALQHHQPDLIVITGDCVVPGGTPEDLQAVLEHLRAPRGVWAVRGNWEHWQPIPNERPFFEMVGVSLLVNEAAQVSEDLWLIGLDDALAGQPDWETAVKGVPAHGVRIALFHSPAYYDQVADHVTLALAGHSHGGQVRLPFYGPLWLPPGTGPYVAGWYHRGPSRLYVCRGIGTTILPIRFLCRPELALITLSPSQ